MSTRFTAQWLRRSRRQFEMKQLHLADELGVSQVMISKWETGAEIPCKKHKRKLYHFFSSCHPTFPDHLMKSLVESSKMYTHLMCDTSHVLLAASESRESEWQRSASELVGEILCQNLPQDILSAEEKYLHIPIHQRIGRVFSVKTIGRKEGNYNIAPTLMHWESFHLADGQTVRLVTNTSSTEDDAPVVLRDIVALS